MQPDAVVGAILGCAVGDAMGLPYEGLSRRRGVRLLGEPTRHRFLFGHGMVSDDTEHTCMAARALCEASTDPDRFARRLARHFRWWLLGIPAGIGFATLRSICKLWLGFTPSRSGVFSAGNGPAMRSAILGAAFDDLAALPQFVRASTCITHTDPKAYYGALAVALAAWCAKRGIDEPVGYFSQLRSLLGNEPADEFAGLMIQIEQSLAVDETTETFADRLGSGHGVSGYVYRTVPIVLHCWLAHPRDYQRAITAVIRCGGDTDTTAAILGAIIGSGLGREGIPAAWLARLWEWPQSVAWMTQLGDAATKAVGAKEPTALPRLVPGVRLLRNVVFLAAVLVHILRRFLPPY